MVVVVVVVVKGEKGGGKRKGGVREVPSTPERTKKKNFRVSFLFFFIEAIFLFLGV